MKLYPKCMTDNKAPALSATGYFLPCCWCDGDKLHKFKNLLKPHFHISKVENIKDIFLSKEWDKFFDRLIYTPDLAPKICKRYCSEPKSIKNKIDYKK